MALTVRALKAYLSDYGDDLPVVFFAVYADGHEEQHSIDDVESSISIDPEDEPGTIMICLGSDSDPVVTR